MSSDASPYLPPGAEKDKPLGEKAVAQEQGDEIASSIGKEDILALQEIDPALNAKMHLVNNVR